MKKTIILLLVISVFISCKNDKTNERNEEIISTESSGQTEKESDGLSWLKGDFVYYADAAVLQTQAEIYGVVIDKKMHELDEQVQQYKTEATDMIPVEIKGKIIPKPENEEGWPFRVEIKEIITVVKPTPKLNNAEKTGQK